jgi:hypothetical protein
VDPSSSYTSTRKPGRDEGQFKSGMCCPDRDHERDCHGGRGGRLQRAGST